MGYAAASDIIEFGQFNSDDAVNSTLTTYLGVLCTSAQAIIDAHCHRSFGSAAASDMVAATRTFDAYADVDDMTLWLDEDLYGTASDITITNGDGSAVLASDYVFEPRNTQPKYAIRLLWSTGLSWQYPTTGDPEDAISILGCWTYAMTTPADIKQATMRLAYHFYKQRETDSTLDRPLLTPSGHTIMPGKLPNDVITLLGPYVKARVGDG